MLPLCSIASRELAFDATAQDIRASLRRFGTIQMAVVAVGDRVVRGGTVAAEIKGFGKHSRDPGRSSVVEFVNV